MKRAKPVHQYQLRDGDQILTRPVTLREIMSDPKFALGVADRAAQPEIRGKLNPQALRYGAGLL